MYVILGIVIGFNLSLKCKVFQEKKKYLLSILMFLLRLIFMIFLSDYKVCLIFRMVVFM